jgi:predicted branched-subunit amino acid permease
MSAVAAVCAPCEAGTIDGPIAGTITDTTVGAITGPNAEARRLRATAVDGVRDMVPMTLSVLPFALTIGAVLASSSIGPVEGILSGPLILAGAAQMMAVQMLEDGAAPAVIVLSALLVNLRIILYSTALAPWFRDESLGRRLLLAIPVIDPLYFVTGPRFERCDLDRRHRQAYYAGAAGLLVTGWVVAQTAAILAGAQAPDAVGLHLGAPLALAGMLAKSIPTRPALVAALSAGVLVVAGAGLPFNSAVLVAAVGGVATGALVANRTSSRTSGPESGRESERSS